jgi:hypothetical protein
VTRTNSSILFRSVGLTLLLSVTLLLSAPAAVNGQDGDARLDVGIEPAFPNLRFDEPLHVTHAGDGSGRLFVVEQRGVITAISESTPDAASTFLDIRDRVTGGRTEEGLLGLAFDPAFGGNGRFYVYYSAIDPRRSVIS